MRAANKDGLRRVLLATLNSKLLYHRPRELSIYDAALSFASKKKSPEVGGASLGYAFSVDSANSNSRVQR
jgi:hypothetical protein